MLLIRPHHILHALASISYLFLALFGFPFRSAEKKLTASSPEGFLTDVSKEFFCPESSQLCLSRLRNLYSASSYFGTKTSPLLENLTVQIGTRCYSSVCFSHSGSKQRTDQRVLVLTLKFLALKITSFSLVKNSSQNFFDFCLSLFYATFHCGPYNFFKKFLN